MPSVSLAPPISDEAGIEMTIPSARVKSTFKSSVVATQGISREEFWSTIPPETVTILDSSD